MSEEKKAEIEEVFCLAPLPEMERGFRKQIYAASTRKDGDWMTYTYDRHVIMRRLDDPRIAKVFSEHKAKATVARMSPSGFWMASGDSTGQVHIWGPSNFSIKNTVRVTTHIMDIDWDSESKKFVACGKGGEVLGKMFPFDSSNAVGSCTNHTKAIISCSVKPSRPYKVITGGEDLSVNFYKAPPVSFESQTEKHSRYPNTVAFSPDGNNLISIGADSLIVAYNPTTGEVLKEIADKENGHKGAIYCGHWSPDSKQFITASADKTCKIWDFESGKVVTTFTVAAKPTVNDMQMACLWHKEYIISVSLSGDINYWDPAKPEAPKMVVQGHSNKMCGMATDKANGCFYTSDNAGRVCRWKDGRAEAFSGKGHEKAIAGIALSCDGNTLYTVGTDDKLRANECKSMEFNTDACALGGSPKDVAAGNKSPELAVAVLAQGKIVVVKNGKVVSTTDITYKPTSIALNADDTEVMVGGADKKVHFYAWKGDALIETRTDDTHVKKITSCGYTPAGQSVSTSADLAIRVCEKDGSLKNKSMWEFHTATVNQVAFNKSGDKAVSVGMDLSVILWRDTEKFSTKRSTVKNAQMDSVDRVDWLDDNTFVTTGGDGSIKVWKSNV